jgi:hypothetical protein
MNKSNQKPICTEANFVGNRLATALDLVGPDKKTLREKYLVGEPRNCPCGTAEDMKRKGFVGIYEKESHHRIPPTKLTFLMQRAVHEW